jgi:hypothetical protein
MEIGLTVQAIERALVSVSVWSASLVPVFWLVAWLAVAQLRQSTRLLCPLVAARRSTAAGRRR